MTVLWLIVWALNGTAVVDIANPWGITLIACLAIDTVAAFTWQRRSAYFHGFGRTWTPDRGWKRQE